MDKEYPEVHVKGHNDDPANGDYRVDIFLDLARS
jgi:hypothetical protein